MDMIGNRSLDLEVLKQPRGFLRCIQWFIAMLAFSICANFSSHLDFDIVCKKPDVKHSISQPYQYPFKLDHIKPQKIEKFCGTDTIKEIRFGGDFSSDAQFFVFTGVICWLYCFISLAVYVFFTNLYTDEQKNVPMIDFCVSVVIAVFWLAGSSAWANSLSGLKNVGDPGNWIGDVEGPCKLAHPDNGPPVPENTAVDHCDPTFAGSFGGANVSVMFGFLNFFLWTCNLWYLYKETKWHTPAGPVPGQQQNVESPPTI
jgi:hypothetical protein